MKKEKTKDKVKEEKNKKVVKADKKSEKSKDAKIKEKKEVKTKDKKEKEELKKKRLEEKKYYKGLSKEDKKKYKKEHPKKSGVIYYFKQVINELILTVWPNKPYMIKYSIATFATIIICSVYFSLIYLLFSFIKELR